MVVIKYKFLIPYIVLAITIFFAVSAAFVCYGAFDAKRSSTTDKNEVVDFMQKNIYVSVCNGETNTLDTNYIVSLDPKDMSISMIRIPSDTMLEIASSNQMIKDVVNIGGMEMLREQLEKTIPLPLDYHLIIKSDDLYCEDGNYGGVVEYVFGTYLWEVADLEEYITQFLGLSSTDLTLVKTDEYAEFLQKFKEHSNKFYNLPGDRKNIGGKIFFVIDYNQFNELMNTEINN